MKKIKDFLGGRLLLVGAIGAVIIAVLIAGGTKNNEPEWTSESATKGTVRNIISVSGVIDAVNSAELAFSVPGTLESVQVKEGEVVGVGKILATLSHNDLKADYQDAYAALLIAQADRDELVNGLRPEERLVAKTTAEIAREDLERITNEQNGIVENAYRALLSSNLEAQPKNKSNNDTHPIVGGTYTCDTEGEYILTMFASSARSGYSYRLSGLESGTFTAFTESAAPLGNCGLTIQFAEGEAYGNSVWIVKIPNNDSSEYVGNYNTYSLALTQRTNAIREAEQNLALAEQNERLDTAAPRREALSREEARVLQARARLNVVSAQMENHILRAPFAGTVSKIEPVVGEALSTEPVITMVSDNAFALTALIPEIDVTRISLGQKAEIVFDARQSETLRASLIFISPLAREIDGVSYFEAKLVLDEEIDWIRSGLNADIDIIVEERDSIIRIPTRYLIGEEDSYTVLVPDGEKTRSVPVTVTFRGNDGYVGIDGLEEGATIIAP